MPNAQEMSQRVQEFTAAVAKYVEAPLPTPEERHAAQQLQHAARSLVEGYEASCGMTSRTHLATKLARVVEETEDCCFWIRMLVELSLKPPATLTQLAKQAEEIFKALSHSIATARHRCRPAR